MTDGTQLRKWRKPGPKDTALGRFNEKVAKKPKKKKNNKNKSQELKVQCVIFMMVKTKAGKWFIKILINKIKLINLVILLISELGYCCA